MLSEHQPLIVNAVANLAGAIAFAIFLTLALRGATIRQWRDNVLSIGSAALALLWNAASFLVLLLPPGVFQLTVEAVRYSALSLLPAVLLDLSLSGRLRRLAKTGYVVSGVAIAMHLLELAWPADLHQRALLLVAGGFTALTVASAAGILLAGGHDLRGRLSRTLASMGLLLFVVTLTHMAFAHPVQAWSKELFLHHVGIPIALWILLRDYRFVFLDAFVRFLANVILAACMALVGVRFLGLPVLLAGAADPRTETLIVAGWCGLFVLFGYLRGAVQQLLSKVVFRQSDVRGATYRLRAGAADFRGEPEYLLWSAQRIAAFFGTERFETVEGPFALDYPAIAAGISWLRQQEQWAWVEAAAPVRAAQASPRILLLGRRRGGRRYLSEDLLALNQLANAVAEEVERFRAAEMQRLVSEAELRALQSQINPHFLFNALNTLYGIIPREAQRARRTVLNLSDIFRYILQSDKALIPLAEEMKIVSAYLEIERLRLGSRLNTAIQVDRSCEQTPIPILSIQPLVENAIKHGIAASAEEGWLRLTVTASSDEMTVAVEDSGCGGDAGATSMAKGAGVGLANVTRRLQLYFGPAAGVTMRRGESGTRVEFSTPLARPTG
jgi:two-component system, LytTR family, sensor kinase